MSSIQPVTFYVPSSATMPMEVDVAHSGLRMVLVSREAIHMLDSAWGVLGVYFLLGPADDPDRYRAYVGEVGRRTLRMRIMEHATQKPFWNRALLIASSSDNFNSAEIGWLEGRLYDVLNNAVAAEIINRGRPGDDSIAARDQGVLERYVEPIMAALRACGASPDTADQKPEPRGRPRHRRYSESVKDLIDAGLIKPGTRLSPLRRGLSETALVLDDGALEVAGVRHEHVSPAAQAVSAKQSEPGWDFWGAPSGDGGHVPLARLRQRLREVNSAPGPPERPATMSSTAAEPISRAESTPQPRSRPGRRATGRMRQPRAPAGADDAASRARYTVGVADLIAAGDLRPDERLVVVYKGQRYETELLSDGRARGIDGGPDQSISTVGKQLTGRAVNGWDFWSVERNGGLVRLAAIRAARVAAPDSS
jgi:hypothetical protein